MPAHLTPLHRGSRLTMTTEALRRPSLHRQLLFRALSQRSDLYLLSMYCGVSFANEAK